MDHRDWPQGVPNGDGAPAGFCRRLNGDDVLKNLKWIGIGLVLAMVLCIAVEGSLANTAENNYKLSIVQITLERGSNGLHLVGNNRELRPAANDTNTKATVKLNETLTLTVTEDVAVKAVYELDHVRYAVTYGVIDTNGDVNENGEEGHSNEIAVRPALWVDVQP